MLELQIAQEASLVEPVEYAINDCGPAPDLDEVIDCTIAAARFNLGALLCMCEILLMTDQAEHMYKEPLERLPCSVFLQARKRLQLG